MNPREIAKKLGANLCSDPAHRDYGTAIMRARQAQQRAEAQLATCREELGKLQRHEVCTCHQDGNCRDLEYAREEYRKLSEQNRELREALENYAGHDADACDVPCEICEAVNELLAHDSTEGTP